MKAEPQDEHRWLEKLVGDWTYEMDASMDPDAPRVKVPATETFRSIGGVWVQGEGTTVMPNGETGTTIMTLGYDPGRKSYVGTFIGTMMSYLWVYESGEVDGNTLTLYAEGPSFILEGVMVKYRDRITFESDDHRVLTSSAIGADGEWKEFMKIDYWRKK